MWLHVNKVSQPYSWQHKWAGCLMLHECFSVLESHSQQWKEFASFMSVQNSFLSLSKASFLPSFLPVSDICCLSISDSPMSFTANSTPPPLFFLSHHFLHSSYFQPLGWEFENLPDCKDSNPKFNSREYFKSSF